MRRALHSYHTWAFCAAFCWSLAYMFTRLALSQFSPLPLGFLRCLMASGFMLMAGFFSGMKIPRRKDIKLFLFAGAAGFSIYIPAFNQGFITVTSATSSVIISSAPILTALLAMAFLREKVGRLQWAAIGVEFCGILVLFMMKGAFTVNSGILWLFLAALVLSVYNLLQKELTKTYSGLETAAYSMMAGALLLVFFAPQAVRELRAASPAHVLSLVMLSLFPSAIAYAAWSKAFERTQNTAAVSNYMFLVPLLAALLGFVVQGERLDLPTIIGGGLILSGLAIFNLGKRGTPEEL